MKAMQVNACTPPRENCFDKKTALIYSPTTDTSGVEVDEHHHTSNASAHSYGYGRQRG